MNPRLLALVALGALLSAQHAGAQSTRFLDDCGGKDFRFCVAIAITAIDRTVTVGVWNYSGIQQGRISDPGAGLFSIAFYGVDPFTLDQEPVFRDPGAGFADGIGLLSGGTRVDSETFEPNPPLTEGWILYARGAVPGNPALSAGLQSDAAGAISSGCPSNWSVSTLSVSSWLSPCAFPNLTDATDPGWVQFSFNTVEAVDWSEAYVELAARVGGQVAFQCIGAGCAPATVVPEPATMLLMATGLAGIGGAAIRRRRKVA